MNTVTNDAELDRRLARNPIAIVGLSGLFPRSRNLREFWGNIVGGTDCMQDVPDDHWRLADYYDADPAAEDKSYCNRGGFLPEILFSPLEFGLPPKTLEVTDILQLLSLVVARDLLRDAGCDQATWYDPSRTGVIVGVTCSNALIQPLVARLQTPVIKEVVRSCGLSERDATEIAAKFKKAFIPWEENSFPGMLANLVAGRIANRFNLGSTNCTVDAACASSLAAIKMSVSELLEGRADLMLSGGCDAENTIFMYMCFSKTPAFSKSGAIRPFDAAGDGTLIGEGIGLLALKRLADAERDQDRIYAVIRGIGTASDGRFKSIYAPRAAGQVTCLNRAYEDADCSPATVELIEAHGTGTAVGDATELSALTTVFGAATPERQFAAVGSVKSQIGHTKAAAGAAGMIKAALALHHKVLPPTINLTNPAVDLESTAFYATTESRPWIRDPQRPRRAAVSAFGFGGTDFHVVLQEHDTPAAQLRVMHPTAQAFVWHAADQETLARLLDEGAASASEGPIPQEHARLGFAAAPGDIDEMLALARNQLQDQATREVWAHPRGVFYRRRAAAGLGRVAALFSGQGGQYVDMGRTAVLNLPPVRTAFDEANQQFAGAPTLSSVVFPIPSVTSADSAEALQRTEYAQPAICALACGQYRFLSEVGFAPDGMLGHSLGELTALWAAGCFGDEDLFRLARARGRAMSPVEGGGDTGAMAVIKAPEVRVRELLADRDGVVICNYNSPDQLVVGGGGEAIDDLLAECTRLGLTAQRLAVSGAFHTRFVEHAVEQFRPAVEEAAFRPPTRQVYANTADVAYGDDLTEDRRILTEQLINPVHFASQVRAMYRDGFRVFVEFGPRRVLSRLVTATLTNHDDVLVSAVDGGPGQDSDVCLKRAAVELAVLGLGLSGINRYAAVPDPEPVPSQLTIPITGVNIVSKERKAAYRNALEHGYTIAPVPATPAAVVAPETQPTPVLPPVHVQVADTVRPSESVTVAPSGAVSPSGDDGFLEVARQHIALHSDYLEGQLRTGDQLAELAGRGAEGRALAEAIKGHGLALGRAHTRASEILRDLALQGGRPSTNGNGSTPVPAVAAPSALQPVALSPVVPQIPIPALVIPVAPTPPTLPTPTAEPASEAGPDPVTVEAELLAIVADKTGYPADMLEPGMDMEADLGIDSIKRVEILGALREGYPQAVTIGPEQLAELRTLRDVIALIAPEAVSEAATPAQARPDRATVERELLAIVADKTGYPADMLEPGMDMEADLGIDSIKRVEILGALREGYPHAVTIGPEQLAELRTLNDVITLIAPAADVALVPETSPDPVVVELAPVVPAPIVRRHPWLRTLPEVDRQPAVYTGEPIAIVVDDGSPLYTPMTDALSAAGWEIAILRLPGAPLRLHERHRVWDLTSWDEQELDDAEAALDGVTQVELVLYLAGEAPATWTDATERLAHAVMLAKHVQQPLVRAAQQSRAAFVTVSRGDGAFGLRNASGTMPTALLGGLRGVVKTLAIEAPDLFCRTLDIAAELPDETAARLVIDEIYDVAAEPIEVGRDSTRRQTVGLTEESPQRSGPVLSELSGDDLLLVTGGGRGVTAACLKALMRQARCRLVLMGRTVLGDEPDWAVLAIGEAALKAAAADHLRATGAKPTPREVDRLTRPLLAQREIRGTLADLHDLGAEVDYVAADVTDEQATAAVLTPFRDRITGIVHGAGVLADRAILEKTPEEVAAVLAAKLDGLRNVLSVVQPDRLRHLVLFSSVAGFFGNRGQVDYAAANAALNSLALTWKNGHPACHVTAVNWGAWAGGMVGPALQQMFEQRGISLIPLEVGADMFAEQFGRDRAHDVVTVIAPEMPLSARAERAPGTVPVVIERDLTGLAQEPVIRDHSIAERPVLPTTVALGWCVNVLELLHPGMAVSEVNDFKVFQGVAFGKAPAGVHRLQATPQEPYDGSRTEVAIRSGPGPTGTKPHYGGRFNLVPPEKLAPAWVDVGDLAEVAVQASPYEDGTLFHGPALRGFVRTVMQDETRLVAECRLDDSGLANAAYEGHGYNPVLSDLLLQAALVWVRRFRDSACLPVEIGHVELHDRLPSGAAFLVIVDQVRDNVPMLTCTVTACTSDGRVYVRFTDVSLALSQTLDTKFQQRGSHDVRQR